MSDGPSDYGSGYLFESQKGISDRRAGLGLEQGPPSSSDSGTGGGSGSGSGIASLIGTVIYWLIVGMFWFGVQFLKTIWWLIFSRCG